MKGCGMFVALAIGLLNAAVAEGIVQVVVNFFVFMLVGLFSLFL